MPQIKIERAWWRPAAVISSAAVAFALTAVPTAALADEVGSRPSDELTKQEQVISGDQGDSTLVSSSSTPSSTLVNNEGGSSDLVGGVNGGTSGGSSSSETVTKPGNTSTENGGSTPEDGSGSSSLPDNGNTNEGGLPGNESSGNADNGNDNDSGSGSDSVTDNTDNGNTVTGETNTDMTPVPDGGESAVAGETGANSTLDSDGASDTTVPTPSENDPNGFGSDNTFAIGSALNNNSVLDVANGSQDNQANVQIYQSNMSDAQKWEAKWFEDGDGEGYYAIFLKGTNKVLDVQWGEAKDGSNVWLYEFDGSLAQRWSIIKNGDFFSILSHLGNNLYLDVQYASTANGTNVWIYTGNGSDSQKFRFMEYYPALDNRVELEQGDGVYVIGSANAPSGNLVLDVNSASKDNYANIQLYESNGTLAQQFYFKNDGNGFYTITNLNSGKALDLQWGNITPGTNVQQYDASFGLDNDAQKWAILESRNESGTLLGYFLVNKLTGLALDVQWASYANYSNVWAYTFDRSGAQLWSLEQVEFLEDGFYTISSASDSNLVFDIQNGSSQSGANAQVYSSNDTLAQRFEIVRIEGTDDEFRIRTAASGGWLTVVDGAVVQIGDSHTEVNQNNTWKAVWNKGFFSLASGVNGSWNQVLYISGNSLLLIDALADKESQRFIFTNAQLIADGYYEMGSALDSDLTLDVANGVLASGSNVQIYSKNDSNAQKFYISWSSQNKGYVITAGASNYAVEVEWGLTDNGSNVRLYEKNGSIGQTWIAEIADGGGIVFKNLLTIGREDEGITEKALDVQWANASAGANVWLYDYSGNPSQVWKLTATTIPYGWVQQNGTWKYYDRNGNMLSDSIVAYNLYQQIKNQYSDTNYLIAVDAVQCHVVLFQGSAGNWELVFDALAGTGDPHLASTDTDGYGVTGEGGNPWGSLRGYFKLGSTTTGYTDSNGRREYDSADQLKWFRSIYMDYGFHSTCGNYSDPSQVGKRISHGCIRLLEQYAKMIYDLPKYTMVAVLPSFNGSFQVDQR